MSTPFTYNMFVDGYVQQPGILLSKLNAYGVEA